MQVVVVVMKSMPMSMSTKRMLVMLTKPKPKPTLVMELQSFSTCPPLHHLASKTFKFGLLLVNCASGLL